MNKEQNFSVREIPELNTKISRTDYTLYTLLTGVFLLVGGILFLRSEYQVNGVGMIYSSDEWYVYSPTEERLESIPVEIGQIVQADDVLFEMDKTNIQMEIIRRSDELSNIQSELDDLTWEIRLNSIRPSDPQVVMAEERLEILSQIQQIQSAMVSSLSSLSEQRAIRSLEFYRQQIENLRTSLDTLQTRWAQQWKDAGLLEIEQERLISRQKRLNERYKLLQQEIDLLKSQLSALSIRAPIAGTVVDLYYRHQGMRAQKGDRMAKIVRDSGQYRVRTYLDQRNYDLVSVGLPVRMESEVFNSMQGGYIMGTVSRIGKDIARKPNSDSSENPADAAFAPQYEVWIDVNESPYPLIPGSTVKVHILLGKVPIWRTLLQLPEQRREPASQHRTESEQ
jgi:multidrug resistance efflux pump